MAHQQLSNDYEKLKQEEAEKSARLQELMYVKSHKNSKLANDIINTKLATPKKSKKNHSNNKSNNNRKSTKWDNEKSIERICDYYDELQYNYEYFNNKTHNVNISDFDDIDANCGDNKSSNNFTTNNNNLNQFYQLTKLRKDILNRKLIDHRERLKTKYCSDKNAVTSISSVVESLTIPTFHFHLILSLTMVLLTHQCPHYLLVL